MYELNSLIQAASNCAQTHAAYFVNIGTCSLECYCSLIQRPPIQNILPDNTSYFPKYFTNFSFILEQLLETGIKVYQKTRFYTSNTTD
jgi:hypothetical protein